jgi:hypothetical protein
MYTTLQSQTNEEHVIYSVCKAKYKFRDHRYLLTHYSAKVTLTYNLHLPYTQKW